jgi:hypothetical protein
MNFSLFSLSLSLNGGGVHLKTLIISPLLRKFPAHFGTRRFLTVFTTAGNWTPIMSQLKSFYIFTPYFLKICLSIILPFIPKFLKLSFSPRHLSCSVHLILLDLVSLIISARAQVMFLFQMLSSESCCQIPSICVLLLGWLIFTPIQNTIWFCNMFLWWGVVYSPPNDRLFIPPCRDPVQSYLQFHSLFL